MSITIREAEVSDAPAISALIADLRSFYLEDPDAEEVQPFLDSLGAEETGKRIESSSYSFHIAENQTGLCGVVAVRDGSHLYHLFVRADLHGQGLARALWEHARKASGARAFTVNSSLFAVPVYERLGFTATSPAVSENGLTFVPMQFSSPNEEGETRSHSGEK